jgi:geranylgeranylglycerol-phosphate geranylgeranyltransferase
MNKIVGLLRLIRFELPFSAGVCVVMGQLLALEKFASAFTIISGFSSIFLISASILVLNDYFDVETDRVNAPHRPIPSGLVTKSETLMLSIALLLGGLVLSCFISITALTCVFVLSIIGFLYNRKFKKSGLPGNIMVSFSVGMTFVFGGISVDLPLNEAAIFFGVIAALIDIGEEIAADAMDAEGDKLINSNSLAIKYGKRLALIISGCFFMFVILLTAVPFILKWFTLTYIIPIAFMDFVIAYYSLRLLNSQKDEGRKYIRRIYLGSTFSLIIFIMMQLIGA